VCACLLSLCASLSVHMCVCLFQSMCLSVCVSVSFSVCISDPLVDDCVREASLRLQSLGIQIEEVSIPMHPEGVAIWGGILTDGVWETLRYRGSGYNYNSVYSPALFKAMQNWESKLDQFPINVLLIVLLGKYMERYQGKYYAKSKNLLIALRKAYDTVLAKYDLLLMPTCVQKPSSNPATQAELTSEQIISLAFNTVLNTCQFDITGLGIFDAFSKRIRIFVQL